MELKSYSGIDKFETVLMDGQSLLSVPSPLIFSKSPLNRNDAETLLTNGGVLNLLDNLLFNEYIAVEINLVLVNNGIKQLVDLFNKNFIGLILQDGQRQKIIGKIKEVIKQDDVMRNSLKDVGKEDLYWGMKGADEKTLFFDKLVNLTPKKKDEIIKKFYQSNAGECKNIPEILARELSDYDMQSRNTLQTFLRAHYYLELARELGIYLSPHPLRSDYYSFLLDKSAERQFQIKKNLTFEELQQEFIENIVRGIQSPEPGYFVKVAGHKMAELLNSRSLNKEFDMDFGSYIIKEAVQNGNSIIDSLEQIKGSREVCSFREKMKTLKESGANPFLAVQNTNSIVEEINESCERWKKDHNEGIHYQTRKISLRTLLTFAQAVLGVFGINTILTPPEEKVLSQLFGSTEITIKDPILCHSKPYLVLLNKVIFSHVRI